MNMPRFAAIAANVTAAMIPMLLYGVCIPEAYAKQLGQHGPTSNVYSTCIPNKSYICAIAYNTCIYYGRTLGDPSDPTECCGWFESNCNAGPTSPGGGGGAGGPNGGVVPRPPNSGNGGHKVQ
jgi:hypothetical protein